MEVSGEHHGQAALHRGKSAGYSVDRRFGVPQNRSGRYGEDKNVLIQSAHDTDQWRMNK
jgi:hypothetical protein